MMIRFAVGAAFLFAASSLLAQTFEIKGIYIGMTEAQLLEKYPAFRCRNNTEIGRYCSFIYEAYPSVCRELDGAKFDACHERSHQLYEFGPAKPKGYTVNLRDEAVTAISVIVRAEDFGDLAAALQEKYGRPSSDKKGVVENRMGAKFGNESIEWRRGNQALEIKQRVGNIDTGMVHLTPADWGEQLLDESKKKAKATAKNL